MSCRVYSAKFELPKSATMCALAGLRNVDLNCYTFRQTLSPQKCVALIAFLLIVCGQSVDLQLSVLNYREMRLRNEEKLNILSLQIKGCYA